jgi:DNA-binding transcriptional regulator PaaX
VILPMLKEKELTVMEITQKANAKEQTVRKMLERWRAYGWLARKKHEGKFYYYLTQKGTDYLKWTGKHKTGHKG